MNVPNLEKKAFRDMAAEEQAEIIRAIVEGDSEYFSNEGVWEESRNAFISLNSAYRTRQHKLEIPWEHIKPEFKWAAMDEIGDVYVYSTKPRMRTVEWRQEMGYSININELLNIDTSGIDWRESLAQRPEN